MNPMMEMLQQMQLAKQKITEAREQLPNLSVTEVGGGGMVRVTATGNLQITSIVIDPEMMDKEDKEMLEDLLLATINRTLKSAAAMSEEYMQRVTAGFMPNIPGLDLSA